MKGAINNSVVVPATVDLRSYVARVVFVLLAGITLSCVCFFSSEEGSNSSFYSINVTFDYLSKLSEAQRNYPTESSLLRVQEAVSMNDDACDDAIYFMQ